MNLFSNKVRVCRPATMFEQLEERIVLDASIDAGFHGNLPNGLDAAAGWNLEYASDPSVSLDHLLDTGGLDAYPGDLGTPLPSVIIGAVPPASAGATVDLTGVVRITGDPTEQMSCVVNFNPRPLTSNGIQSVTFSAEADDVTVSQNVTTGSTQSWSITGKYDSVNAVLSTMQVKISSSFTGNAEIDVLVTDSDHSTNVSTTPLVSRTLYIPVTAGAASSGGPSVTPIDLEWDLTAGVPDNIFDGILVDDTNAHVLDMGVRVFHGVIGSTSPLPAGVQLLLDAQPPTMTPPGTPSGDAWTASSVMVRGAIPALNTWLAQITYDGLDGWGSSADTVADDYVQITLDDRATAGNPMWQGDQFHRTAQTTIPIVYIP